MSWCTTDAGPKHCGTSFEPMFALLPQPDILKLRVVQRFHSMISEHSVGLRIQWTEILVAYLWLRFPACLSIFTAPFSGQGGFNKDPGLSAHLLQPSLVNDYRVTICYRYAYMTLADAISMKFGGCSLSVSLVNHSRTVSSFVITMSTCFLSHMIFAQEINLMINTTPHKFIFLRF